MGRCGAGKDTENDRDAEKELKCIKERKANWLVRVLRRNCLEDGEIKEEGEEDEG